MKNLCIPATWELVPLKELGQWSGGGTPSKAKPEYWEKGKIPWVSPKDMKTERITDSEDHITQAAVEESTAKLISTGSVLIVTRSGILSHTLPVAVTTVPVTVNQDLKALTPKEGVLPEYVAWALRCFAREILNTCSKQGTTVNSIETAALHRFEIPLAPLDQQKRIVAEIEKQFSRLDEAVANLKRVKANLKRYKAAVLKAAVEGRLVETEAELARREGRSFETGEQLLQRILETRRSQWKGKGKYKEPAAPDTTDLPELPEGWVYATAEQLTDENRAITYGVIKLGDPVDGGVPVLRSSDVRQLRIDLDDVKHISPKIAENYRRTFLKGGEVVMTVRGTLGGIAVVPPQCNGFNVSREVAMLALIEPDMAQVISLFIASAPLEGWLMRRTKGIAYTGINIETLKALPIPAPPMAEQHRIVAEVDRRLSLIREIEIQADVNLKRVERLRQSILFAAFSGRLKDVGVDSLVEPTVRSWDAVVPL